MYWPTSSPHWARLLFNAACRRASAPRGPRASARRRSGADGLGGGTKPLPKWRRAPETTKAPPPKPGVPEGVDRCGEAVDQRLAVIAFSAASRTSLCTPDTLIVEPNVGETGRWADPPHANTASTMPGSARVGPPPGEEAASTGAGSRIAAKPLRGRPAFVRRPPGRDGQGAAVAAAKSTRPASV